MKCLSCDAILKDEEASRKYLDEEHIKNPEDKYINLCNRCLNDSDLNYYNDDPYSEEEVTTDDRPPLDLTGDCV